MTEEDTLLIIDMIDPAEQATRILGTASVEIYSADEGIYRGVERCVEIVGEAANKASADVRSRFPHIPWQVAADTRHRFIHGYRTVSHDITHRTVTRDFPLLIADLKAILKGYNP